MASQTHWSTGSTWADRGLLFLIVGLKGSENTERPEEMKSEDEELEGLKEESSLSEDPEQELSLAEVLDLTATSIPNGTWTTTLSHNMSTEVSCMYTDPLINRHKSNVSHMSKMPIVWLQTLAYPSVWC